MANEKISDIPRSITVADNDDIMEVQSPGLGSTGSAQIPVADVIGGVLLDYGVFTLNNAATVLWTIPFNYTLAVAPGSYEVCFLAPSGNSIVIYGNALIGSSTTQFQIQLSGPIGDTVHQVRWKAFK